MKRSLAHIGYIAGLMERKGYIKGLNSADRTFTVCFSDWDTALYVNSIMKGKISKRPDINHDHRIFVYVSTVEAIGWFMTCYSIVSPSTKDRILHAILQWKSRMFKGIKNRPSKCHPRRPFYAKGKCELCYHREYRGILHVNIRKEE